jgi:hypothetical protein
MDESDFEGTVVLEQLAGRGLLASPIDRLVRSAEGHWHPGVVREPVADGENREATGDVELRAEGLRGQQEAVHSAEVPCGDVDEEATAARGAEVARVPLQRPHRRAAACDLDIVAA